MKRLIFALTLLTAAALTSCEAHFFDVKFDIPWQIIAVFVFAVFFITHLVIIGGEYKCPDCGAVFKPKWYEFSAWIHQNGERVARCPRCAYKGFCKREE